jgi:hypothetical protein
LRHLYLSSAKLVRSKQILTEASSVENQQNHCDGFRSPPLSIASNSETVTNLNPFARRASKTCGIAAIVGGGYHVTK